jgi:hypothetical protein
MPRMAASSASRAGAGGSSPLAARTNSSKPAGSVTSRKRASSEATTNVCGTSRGT